MQETAGVFTDPFHGHSFQRTAFARLSGVERSLIFFRDCVVCQQRLLSVGRSSSSIHNAATRKRKSPGKASPVLPSTTSSRRVLSLEQSLAVFSDAADSIATSAAGFCQCLSCALYAHRECLTQEHTMRVWRGPSVDEESYSGRLPHCAHEAHTAATRTTEPRSLPVLFPAPDLPKSKGPPRLFGNEHAVPTFTLSALLEELSRDPLAPATSSDSTAASAPLTKSSSFRIKGIGRFVPLIAAGGLIGAVALTPVGGLVAGLNMLMTGVGAEAVMAGLGVTVATAAAAKVSHESKLRRDRRRQERLKSGAWAMEICWNCKQNFHQGPSDETCRKDAELLRRFQAIESRNANKSDLPDHADVYAFLFGIFASPSEFLGQVNMQLCQAFRDRFARRKQEQLQAKTATTTSSISCETLQDAKMYIAHVLGATMQSFPSLASTEYAVQSTSCAIERIVYDDIYAIVFGEFQRAFAAADRIFHEQLDRIREDQQNRPLLLLYVRRRLENGAAGALELHEELRSAQTTLMQMVHATYSPLQKLELLAQAFRHVCCFADQLHQTAANADILIPILCAFFVAASDLLPASDQRSGSKTDQRRHFVSEIAFISFFTNGGGRGADGYVLTTIQAVVQVIAAVDLSEGPARELEQYMQEEHSDTTDSDEDEEQFFDAAE